MADTPEDAARMERAVRDYYNANGWPDELFRMGLKDAVAFAFHFRRAALEEAAKVADELEYERNLSRLSAPQDYLGKQFRRDRECEMKAASEIADAIRKLAEDG